MMKCCITCFALLLTISLTHATGLLRGSGGGMSYLFHNLKQHIVSLNDAQ